MTHLFSVTLFALAQLAAAWGLGAAFLRLARMTDPPGERLCVHVLSLTQAAAVGLGLMSLFVVLVFFFHAPVRASFVIAGAAGVVLAVREALRMAPSLRSVVVPRLRRDVPWLVPQFMLLLILWSESFVPDVSVDTYFYHFAVPNYFLHEGGFAPQDLSLMVHYPLVMEMLYTPALAFGLEQAAIQLNVLIAGVVWSGMVALGTKLHSPRAGWIAGLVYLLAPSLITIAPTANVETGAALFFLAQLLFLLRAWREADAKAAALAGLAGGWLVGCKLVYGPVEAFLLILLCVNAASGAFNSVAARSSSMERASGALRIPLLFALSAAAAYLPWIIKNTVYLKNPFFPLFLDRFDTPSAIRDYAATQFAVHGIPAWQNPLAWLEGMVRGFAELASTGDIGFQLSILAWLGLCVVTRFRGKAGGYTLLLAAPFLVMSHYGPDFLVRWFLPYYSAFTVAGGLAAAALWKRNRRLLAAPAVLLALVLVWNWGTDYRARLTGSLAPRGPWTALGNEGYATLRERMPGREAIDAANRATPPDGRLLLAVPATIYGGRGVERRFLAGGAEWIETMERSGLSPREIRQRLRTEGFTHVLHRSDAAFARSLDLSGVLGTEAGEPERDVVVSPLGD